MTRDASSSSGREYGTLGFAPEYSFLFFRYQSMPHTPRQSQRVSREQENGLRNILLGDKLSMRDWNVDTKQLFKQLFGKEATVDGIGIMVHPGSTGSASVTNQTGRTA